jgi:hypothetical protein
MMKIRSDGCADRESTPVVEYKGCVSLKWQNNYPVLAETHYSADRISVGFIFNRR